MNDSSFDVDEILKQVRKRREENEAQIKAQSAGIRESQKPADKKADTPKKETAVNTKAETSKKPAAEPPHMVKQQEKPPVKKERPAQSAARAESVAGSAPNQAPAAEKAAAPQRKNTENIVKEQPQVSANPAPAVHYDTDENGNVNIMNYAEIPQTAQKKTKKAKKKASKLTKILRAVIAILLVLIITGGAGIYIYMNNILNSATENPEQTQTLDEWSGMDVLVENFDPINEDEYAASYRDMIRKWYYNGSPASSTHVLNVLLIGEDTRDEEITDQDTRADSAIIASVNIDTQQITLTSILRDSYIYYEVTEGDEDSGRYGKINEAMYYGGIDCYIRAVENNFKINIDNYVIVNFDSFESIIDTLGGITVEMTAAEIREINNHPSRYGNVSIDAEEGLVDLSGEQALAYCRIRYIDSDNARADRQKTVLLKIFEKMKNASTVKSLEVANNLLPYVKMGFSKSELLDIGSYALGHGWLSFQTNTQTVPENTTDENGEVITTCRGGNYYGAWCWKVDLPLSAQLIQQSIYGKTNITLAQDRVDFDDLPLY